MRRRLFWSKVLGHVLGIFFLLLLFAATGKADSVVCEGGPGADQCSNPRDVAVDTSNGTIYVADGGNNRIDVFESDGDFLRAFGWGVEDGSAEFQVCASGCLPGVAGGGPGQFAGMQGIAVDNDPTSPAFHDVYVLEQTNDRVQRFHPDGEVVSGGGFGDFAGTRRLDVGPGGGVHVADIPTGNNRRVQEFDHEGNQIEEFTLPLPPNPPPLPPGFGETLAGFAVDASGNFYLASAGGRPIRKYAPGGAELANLHPSFNIQTIATDSAGNLFVADVSEVETAIHQYTSAGAPVRVFYGDGTLQNRPLALAPFLPFASPGGDIVAAEGGGAQRVLQVAFPPPGPVVHPDPDLTVVDPIGNTKATVKTRINPEGKASEYRFQYVEETIFQEDLGGGGTGWEHAQSTPSAAIFPGDFKLHDASAEFGCPDPEIPPQPSCLKPETEYRFRALAKNVDSGIEERIGPAVTFTTADPFEITDTWATDVGADSALVHAEVNPLGIEASAHFEYVEEETFEKSGFAEATETPEIDLGSEEDEVTAVAQLHTLIADTVYRFRVEVENAFDIVRTGAEALFETFPLPSDKPPCPNDAFRTGASAPLPDCRAYEMVSPPDKAGGEIRVQPNITGFPASVEQAAGSGGKLAYASYRAFGDAVSAPYTSQYIATRHEVGEEDEGWSTHGISPPSEGAAVNAFLRLETQFKAFSDDLAHGWLLALTEPPLDAGALPGYANLYRRDDQTDSYESICSVEPPTETPGKFVPEFQGAPADGALSVFRANDKLIANASEAKLGTGASIYQLYACEGGEPRLASVLPGGAASDLNSGAGTSRGNLRKDSLHNAVAENGSRIYWSAFEEDALGPGKLYLRENPMGEGAECSGADAPCTVAVSEPLSSSPAQYWTASPNGEKAIFSFTGGPLGGNLYEFDAVAGTRTLIAEGVSGLAGWSEDASRLYLVSDEVLAPGAETGEANLYFYEAGSGGGSFELVATLPGGPNLDNYCAIDNAVPFEHCARTTPDGTRLAFMTSDRLSEYDNTTAADSAEAAVEIYLYDSTAQGGAGELHCVSCNPSGGRAATRSFVIGPATIHLAAQIPNWENAFHASRVLSEDGSRLFFESFDALVLSDTNGVLDVYEWSAADNEAQCEEMGAELHAPSAGGCLGLISTGKSPRDSELLDASADGADVFFKTAASLLPQDPGLLDIYDARAGGGFPLSDPPQPPCEGEACQSPPPAPEGKTPATQGESAGNPPPPSNCTGPARKAKSLARQAKRARKAAQRTTDPQKAQTMRRKAKRLNKRAKQLSNQAKRCRAGEGGEQ